MTTTNLIKRLDNDFGLPSLLDSVFPSRLLKDYTNWDSFYTTDVFPYDVKEYRDKNGNIKKHELVFAVAGVHKDDISVRVEDDWLIVSIEQAKDDSINSDDMQYIRKGLSHRSMYKKFYLRGVDKSKIESQLENGLLTITAPPNKDHSKAINIKVN